MRMRGPAVFLAQFLRDESPFDELSTIVPWMTERGFNGVQIPAWDARAIDLGTAATSRDYCDEYRATLAAYGAQPTELAAYLAGQVLAMHPLYEPLFQGFFPDGLSGERRSGWAAEQIRQTILASANLGTTV